MKKTICALVAAAAFNLSGCANKNNGADENNGRNLEVLNGVPISVAESYAQYGGSISIVIESGDKKVLASSDSTNTFLSARAEALVQSEINDNDQESIGLLGYFEDNEFKFRRLNANGYTINFED